MRFFDYLIYLIRLAWFLFRLVLFQIYGVLLFLSKPGAIIIVPGALGAVFYWYPWIVTNLPVFDAVSQWLGTDVRTAESDTGNLLMLWIGVTVSIAILAEPKNKLLATVLAALPRIQKPLPPSLRLRIKEQRILPARVARMVPKLKRSRRSRRSPDFTSGLADPLKQLVTPPQTPLELPPVVQAPQPTPSPVIPPQAAPTPPQRPTRPSMPPPAPPKNQSMV